MGAILRTDLYQVAMAAGYIRSGRAEDGAVFHLYFRRAPHGGRHAVVAGIAQASEYLRTARFEESDIEYLGSLKGNDGGPLFDGRVLDHFRNASEIGKGCVVHAMREGEVVFPNEPILRIQGPIWRCQIAETFLLNAINFQTLVASKAARIVKAAAGRSVVEFGLRRAPGPDGGLSATRAAYIGGCDATSNLEAGSRYGIPVVGTHAHSWAMSFESETEAFEAWARVMPNNASFLIDTYNIAVGAARAAAVAQRLLQGRPFSVRIDSGDLAEKAREVRGILDAAGCQRATIVVSNDLDEHKIANLVESKAPIDTFGVGTSLAIGGDGGALGGVFKLGRVRQGEFSRDTIKVSGNDPDKSSLPGSLQVARFGEHDVIYDERDRIPESSRALLVREDEHGDLNDLVAARVRTRSNLSKINDSHTVSISEEVLDRKRRLMPVNLERKE